MIEYAIHKGRRVIQTGACLRQHLAAQLTAFPDCEITEVQGAHEGACYIENGQLIPMPERPSPFHRFDYAILDWVDDRSAEQISAQAALDFTEAKRRAITLVNAWAARERIQYVTPLPGQDMIYLAKEAEALRYLADPDPAPAEYPLICAEVGVTAPDAYQIAQIWAQMAALWRQVAAQIETARLGTIRAITEAGDEDSVSAALAQLPDAG